jgi:hypothetical protein
LPRNGWSAITRALTSALKTMPSAAFTGAALNHTADTKATTKKSFASTS